MQSAGIVGQSRRKFCRTTDSIHCLPVAANPLNRQFEVTRPNQSWVGDVTYIRTGVGWLYSDLPLDDPDLTPELANARVSDYIDHFYIPERRHSTPDYFSPIEYGLKHIVHQQST